MKQKWKHRMKTKDALAQVNLDFSNEDAGWCERHSGRARGGHATRCVVSGEMWQLGRFKEGDERPLLFL